MSYLYYLTRADEKMYCCVKLKKKDTDKLMLKDMIFTDDLNSSLLYCIFNTKVQISQEENKISISKVSYTNPEITSF